MKTARISILFAAYILATQPLMGYENSFMLHCIMPMAYGLTPRQLLTHAREGDADAKVVKRDESNGVE